MCLNGKRDGFEIDLLGFAVVASIKPAKARALILSVNEAVGKWPQYTQEAGVDEETIKSVGGAHRSIG